MSSWLDSMAAKAGIIEEEEEEEDIPEVSVPNDKINEEKNEVENEAEKEAEKTETEENDKLNEEKENDNKEEYFSGTSTKECVNFVRSVERVQQLQEKAYNSALNKVSNSVDKAADLENTFKQAPKAAEFSNESKEKYGNLRSNILNLRGFTKIVH